MLFKSLIYLSIVACSSLDSEHESDSVIFIQKSDIKSFLDRHHLENLFVVGNEFYKLTRSYPDLQRGFDYDYFKRRISADNMRDPRFIHFCYSLEPSSALFEKLFKKFSHNYEEQSILYLERFFQIKNSFYVPFLDSLEELIGFTFESRSIHINEKFSFFKWDIKESLEERFPDIDMVLLNAFFGKVHRFRSFPEYKDHIDLFTNLTILSDALVKSSSSKYMGVFSIFYFMQLVCDITSDFFLFPADFSPRNLFSKFMALLHILILSQYNAELEELKIIKIPSKTMQPLLDSEYLNFMKIFRDQYILTLTQYSLIQHKIDQNYAAERFSITKVVLTALYWSMTVIINYPRILEGKKDFLVYKLDFDHLDKAFSVEFEREHSNFSTIVKKLPKKELFKWKNSTFAITKVKKQTLSEIIDSFLFSIADLIQSPITFYLGEKRIGIKSWNLETIRVMKKKRQCAEDRRYSSRALDYI